MSAKPIVPRAQARRDVDDAVDHYLREADADIAIAFIDAFEEACRLISEHPGAGSPRYAHELDLPGLRSKGLGGYPFLLFYIERANHIDLWRVLHARRDISAWLSHEE